MAYARTSRYNRSTRSPWLPPRMLRAQNKRESHARKPAKQHGCHALAVSAEDLRSLSRAVLENLGGVRLDERADARQTLDSA
jgi:hypothetical protein